MISSDISTNIVAFRAQIRADIEAGRKAVQQGLRDSKEPVRQVLQAEMRRAFTVKQDRFLRTWRISARKDPNSLWIDNIAAGFGLHVEGGTIRPRSRQALLIPINTRLGTRIGTKKFYKLIDWLMREKLTLIRGNILYVKPVMNTSRRGGVAPGTRVNKKFRSKFQGTKRRPSGFDINLNSEGLTAIAVVRKAVGMRARFPMQGIIDAKLVPIVLAKIQARFEAIG